VSLDTDHIFRNFRRASYMPCILLGLGILITSCMLSCSYLPRTSLDWKWPLLVSCGLATRTPCDLVAQLYLTTRHRHSHRLCLDRPPERLRYQHLKKKPPDLSACTLAFVWILLLRCVGTRCLGKPSSTRLIINGAAAHLSIN
jgi:hypothetical protein